MLIAGGGSDKKDTASSGGTVAGLAETNALLRGSPEQAGALGQKDAPVTLTEFADLQCPFCRQFALTTYPVIVNKYVSSGKLRIEFKTLTFLGPDSEKAARAAAAAGQQKREAYFTQLWYFNQGQENSGYATDAFVEKIWKAAGVDVPTARKFADSQASMAPVVAAQKGAEKYGVVSTPTFLIGPDGQAADEVRRRSLGRRCVQGRDRRTVEALHLRGYNLRTVKKTSIYLDEELDQALALRAAEEGITKAELIRRSLRGGRQRPKRRGVPGGRRASRTRDGPAVTIVLDPGFVLALDRADANHATASALALRDPRRGPRDVAARRWPTSIALRRARRRAAQTRSGATSNAAPTPCAGGPTRSTSRSRIVARKPGPRHDDASLVALAGRMNTRPHRHLRPAASGH